MGLESKRGDGAQVYLGIGLVMVKVLGGNQAVKGQSGEAHQLLLLGAVAVGQGGHREALTEQREALTGIRPRRQPLPRQSQLVAGRTVKAGYAQVVEDLIEG